MELTSIQKFKDRKGSDVAIIPFWETPRGAKCAASVDVPDILVPIKLGDFKAKSGETLLIYAKNGKERRLLLLGLGKVGELTTDEARLCYAKAVRLALAKKLTKISLVAPHFNDLRGLTADALVRAMADGVFLPDYHWPKENDSTYLKEVQWIGIVPKALDIVKKSHVITNGVHFARDLINENADTVTPEYLAKLAQQLAKKKPKTLKATILNAAQIHKEKLGLLEAVSRGASVEPRLIILTHRGHPRSKDHTVLVGKGITYDTGGLSLKPTNNMLTMRSDMAGAAAVLATVLTAASLELPLNVTAVVPATENAIGSRSYKPGDVYTAYDGTHVEIGNTDAEGRLVLADAISYAMEKLDPTRIVDIATLTGSVVVALGDELAGLFANNDKLAHSLQMASDTVGEPLWRLPIYTAYREKLKSSVGDLCNVGGRPAGSITAALFLDHFASKKKIPWAHIDCAGPGYMEKQIREWPKLGVGFGVRLFIEFLENLKH